jgi:2-polyprenyl-3-methyl-5-hydroxy-6-metoxy-1,4-benzoquinol methylase
MLSKPAAGKSLLDIGCAFGHFLDCAVERGYQPFGTEISEEMADLLRRRKDYPVSSKSLDDLELPVKQFNVITFVDSFYYFEDPLETLRHCHKLLTPGGELLMRVTNRNGIARLHRLSLALTLRGRGHAEMPFWTTDDAISCHSRRSLAKLMDKTGFRVVKLTCFEKGKKIESFVLRTFYQLTGALALITCERLCLAPGIICLATAD